jgi:hypothetical protein
MKIIYIKFIENSIAQDYMQDYLTLLYLLALSKFIPPIIRKIPPTKIIHLSIVKKNAGIFMKLSPKLMKYNPNSKYKIKNAPPLAICMEEKRYI